MRWRTVVWGLGLELVLALVILKTPWGLNLFKSLGNMVANFLAFSDVGAKFVFGENFKDHFLLFKFCQQSSFSHHLLVFFTTMVFCKELSTV